MPIDQTPPGIVTSALRRMVASGIAVRIGGRNGRLRLGETGSKIFAGRRGHRKQQRNSQGDRGRLRRAYRPAAFHDKMEFIDYPVQTVLLLAQSDAGRILDAAMLFQH